MSKTIWKRRFILLFSLGTLALNVFGTDGTWTQPAGGVWGTAGNWSPANVPDGIDAVADFSTLNLAAHASIDNDAPHTVGTLRFGDTTPSHNWTLTNSTLTLATGAGTPEIVVNNQTATISSGVLGTQGFVKSGAGILILSGGLNNTFSGAIAVNNGTLQTANSSSLKNTSGSISVAPGAVFHANAQFENTAITNAINLSGSGSETYGALNGYFNVNLTGPITLLTDTKITHNWNYFRIRGAETRRRSIV